MRKSKFQGLLDAANGREVEAPEAPETTVTLPDLPEEPLAPATPSAPATRRPGRPAGKHSDPNFRQVSVYLRRDTHQKAKIALLLEGQNREFSELVEKLVAGWLDTQKSA